MSDEDGWCCWCHLCKYCTWSVGYERVGELAKGGAVVSRPGTRVDGNSQPHAKKLVLKVNKHGMAGSKGLGWKRHYMMCKYCNIHMICKWWDSCVQVKNKPSVRCTCYMRLISWIHPLGSETGILEYFPTLTGGWILFNSFIHFYKFKKMNEGFCIIIFCLTAKLNQRIISNIILKVEWHQITGSRESLVKGQRKKVNTANQYEILYLMTFYEDDMSLYPPGLSFYT